MMRSGLYLAVLFTTANSCDKSEPAVQAAPIIGDIADADGRWLGTGPGDWAGRQIGPAGDVDGDGLGDILVSALWSDGSGEDAGATYLLLGPATGTGSLSGAHAILLGEAAHDASGVSVAGAGDVDADGFSDLIVGADGHDVPKSNAGAFYLINGPIEGTISLSEVDAKGTGEEKGDLAGVSVAGAGDTNGDGFDDVLIGARYLDQSGEDAGVAYLMRGPFSGLFSLGEADAKLFGENPQDWLGITVSAAGDVDGDGLMDIAAGALYEDAGGIDSGATYIVRGPLQGMLDVASADAKLVGEAPFDEAARIAGGGDTDGDGHADVWVGAARSDSNGEDSGTVYLVRSPWAGEVHLARADAKFMGEAAGNESGFRLGYAGDVNGDGRDDVVVGGWLDDTSGADAGACYLLLGPMSGSHTLDQADRIWRGADAGDRLCSSASGGDIDGDGLADLLFSAPQQDGGGIDAGAVYIVLASSLTF